MWPSGGFAWRGGRPYVGILAAVAVAGVHHPAAGVVSTSPEVKRVLARALHFLESADDPRLGGKCLIGMALVKNGYPANHPAVIRAVDACRSATAGGPEGVERVSAGQVYSPAIAAIFLCELTPGEGKHDREIRILMEFLRQRQKPHGGWGYLNRSTGDTSQTQYGALSAWVANQAGFSMSTDSVVRVCNWLLRTQDPSGGWGYQGVDPGDSHATKQVKQQQVSESLSVAALGSLYVCANMLGIKITRRRSEPGLPAALQEVRENGGATARRGAGKIDRNRLRTAIRDGTRWFEQHYRIDPPRWTHYYLYALERYMSFRELAEGRPPAAPNWYDDGFRYLAKTQAGDGSWGPPGDKAVDTAFAVLFLSRSTRASMRLAYGSGTLMGGRGLPQQVVDAHLQRGHIVAGAALARAADLIRVLADPHSPDYGYLIYHPELLVNEANRAVLAKNSDRLAELVKRGAPEARRLAVRALGQVRDLDVVPLLIYALSDPDWRVVHEANDGLRLVSRKFGGVGLPPRRDDVARDRAIEVWRKWYLAVRPGAELELSTR